MESSGWARHHSPDWNWSSIALGPLMGKRVRHWKPLSVEDPRTAGEKGAESESVDKRKFF